MSRPALEGKLIDGRRRPGAIPSCTGAGCRQASGRRVRPRPCGVPDDLL